jgi:hypothetical protein
MKILAVSSQGSTFIQLKLFFEDSETIPSVSKNIPYRKIQSYSADFLIGWADGVDADGGGWGHCRETLGHVGAIFAARLSTRQTN